ncbi:hypothetical protein Q5P01_003025 [Channa striata]|uniref:Immunoglobulin V-set domain-containing protein n=1 Tax=Channa striata TaxID=64152 RepID=A0AA88T5A8_CHASR|nr:hypothetical protein Q5P01_003025 [Channa striata]
MKVITALIEYHTFNSTEFDTISCFNHLHFFSFRTFARPRSFWRHVTLSFEAPQNTTVLSVFVKISDHQQYIYCCSDNQPIRKRDQEPRVQGRVKLANGLTCDVPLNRFAIILENVTANDTNTYECVFIDNEEKRWSDRLSLMVQDRALSVWCLILSRCEEFYE